MSKQPVVFKSVVLAPSFGVYFKISVVHVLHPLLNLRVQNFLVGLISGLEFFVTPLADHLTVINH